MIIQWIQEKIMQRKHDIIKLNWKKAELERLLAMKDKLTPEEFMKEYKELTK